jgi:hypothetical protein
MDCNDDIQLRRSNDQNGANVVNNGVGFNTRRASDLKACDYLKPTLSSMQRAKSVVP